MIVKRKQSFIKKIMTWLILFVILPAFILFSLFYRSYIRNNYEKIIDEERIELNLMSESISATASMIESGIKSLAYEDELITLLSNSKQSDYDRVIRQQYQVLTLISKLTGYLNSMNASIVLFADDDKVPISYWKILPTKAAEQTDSYKEFIKKGTNEEWIGPDWIYPEEYVINRDNNSYMFCYYRLIVTSINKRIGVLKCGIPMDTLFSVIPSDSKDKNYYVLMDGNTIYRSNGAPDHVISLNMRNWVEADGYIYISKKIDRMGITLVTALDAADFHKQIIYSAIPMILMLCSFAILLYIVTRLYIGGISNRLEQTIKVANEARIGETFVQLNTERKDELSDLITAFNSLLRQLHTQTAEKLAHETAEKNALRLALQYQMNPHFLFNSLNWIQMSIETGADKEQISYAIVLLGSLLRYNLDAEVMTTLADEIHCTQTYIQLTNMRKHDLIHVEYTLDGLPLNMKLMRFLFQPIFENAVHHGLRPGTPLHIQLSGFIENNRVRFIVVNDGTPIESNKLKELKENLVRQHTANGIGLVNIAMRLNLLYGDTAKIEIESDEINTTVKIEFVNEGI